MASVRIRCMWMRLTWMLLAVLLASPAPAFAQTASPDSEMAQTVIAEIRQLRQDLRNTAATIQRAQILIFRLQSQAAIVDKAAQRLEQARTECKQAQMQKEFTSQRMEQADARKRNPENATVQTAAEESIAQLHSELELLAGQIQQCQVEQADAETQFRVEQAKMNQVSDQLDQLDQVLAGQGSK
jgi:chromosome segregation ATPase